MPVEIRELIIRTNIIADKAEPEAFQLSEADKRKIIEAAQNEVIKKLKEHTQR